MRSVIGDKILEVMKKGGSQSVFRNIMPPKIFTDLYQYYQATVLQEQQSRIASIEMTLSKGNLELNQVGASGFSMNLMAPKLKI
jgi:hypothetical protein